MEAKIVIFHSVAISKVKYFVLIKSVSVFTIEQLNLIKGISFGVPTL